MPPQGRVGDKAMNPADVHGCPACPHPVTGPAIQGSEDVFVNDRPALRVTDPGVHAACCGPNTWEATQGSPTVFINFLPAHRLGDMTTHCGGVGKLIEGSNDVIVGDVGEGEYKCMTSAAKTGAALVQPPANFVKMVAPKQTGVA